MNKSYTIAIINIPCTNKPFGYSSLTFSHGKLSLLLAVVCPLPDSDNPESVTQTRSSQPLSIFCCCCFFSPHRTFTTMELSIKPALYNFPRYFVVVAFLPPQSTSRTLSAQFCYHNSYAKTSPNTNQLFVLVLSCFRVNQIAPVCKE